MSDIQAKSKEVLMSVVPIVIMVLLLNFTLTPLGAGPLTAFIVGASLVVIGLTIFLSGVDVGITPIGSIMGEGIARTAKLWIVILAGLILGFVVSIAEPDLHILAAQVQSVSGGALTKTLILVVVSLGIAALLAIGLSRIVKDWDIRWLFYACYGLIFVLAMLVPSEFLAISFDASGATTGALAVPFFLALGLGTAAMRSDSLASEEVSFGLVGLVSAGAILAVLLMTVLTRQGSLQGVESAQVAGPGSLWQAMGQKLPVIAKEIFLALFPIAFLFYLGNFIKFKLGKRQIIRISFGLIFAYFGLVLFMLGVNVGFMDVGRLIGIKLTQLGVWHVLGIAFLMGLVVILAEPAVYVLTHQIEDVTAGAVKRKMVLIFLAVGVSLAVALSALRILVPSIQLWHFLLPGYVIALGLTRFVPRLFVGMAFDSGGVASGPMTATFILAFAQGVAEATPGADVLVDGFGIIAMVAMMPIVALQILGLIYEAKSKKEA